MTTPPILFHKTGEAEFEFSTSDAALMTDPVPGKFKRDRRKPKKEPTYLTEREVECFFRVVRDPRDRAVFRLLYHRGLRVSEIGLLQFTDYRPGGNQGTLGRARLFVRRRKGSISAEHVLIDAESTAMKAWIRVRGQQPGALFPSRAHRAMAARRQRPTDLLPGLRRERIYVLMVRYCTLAGIPRDKAHPHSFKHSCAMHLVDLLGGDVVAIQDHLGHADVRNTMRYLRAANREARADKLMDWGKK